MVESDAGDGDRADGPGRARGVPTPSHPDLEHHDVDALLGADDERRDRDQVELRDVIGLLAARDASLVHAAPGLDGRGDAVREVGGRDGLAADLQTLVVVHEVGARVEGHALALARQDRGGEARGRGLAVGAGDLDAVIAEVGVAAGGEHVLDGLEQGLDAEAKGLVQRRDGVVEGRLLNVEGKVVHG